MIGSVYGITLRAIREANEAEAVRAQIAAQVGEAQMGPATAPEPEKPAQRGLWSALWAWLRGAP
jgi:hypothetical protein